MVLRADHKTIMKDHLALEDNTIPLSSRLGLRTHLIHVFDVGFAKRGLCACAESDPSLSSLLPAERASGEMDAFSEYLAETVDVDE